MVLKERCRIKKLNICHFASSIWPLFSVRNERSFPQCLSGTNQINAYPEMMENIKMDRQRDV